MVDDQDRCECDFQYFQDGNQMPRDFQDFQKLDTLNYRDDYFVFPFVSY